MQVEIPDEVILDTLRMGEAVAGLADWRGKIARMVESGALVSLRRGLYASRRDLDPHCLAGPIYGPSYVSFETAPGLARDDPPRESPKSSPPR